MVWVADPEWPRGDGIVLAYPGWNAHGSIHDCALSCFHKLITLARVFILVYTGWCFYGIADASGWTHSAVKTTASALRFRRGPGRCGAATTKPCWTDHRAAASNSKMGTAVAARCSVWSRDTSPPAEMGLRRAAGTPLSVSARSGRSRERARIAVVTGCLRYPPGPASTRSGRRPRWTTPAN